MRFAEVFLRLGTSLVAWMMLFAHFLWLAALYVMECGPDGDEMYRLLLGLAPFTCFFALLIRVTRPFADIHRMLRWLAIPLLILLPFSMRSIWRVVRSVGADSTTMCSSAEPVIWQQIWAPAQVITLLFVIYGVLRVWQESRTERKPGNSEIEQSN